MNTSNKQLIKTPYDIIPQLELKNITAGYEDKIVIENISLILQKGEIISLIGKSGIGKSTLLNAISGLIEPKDGKVYLMGKDITGTTGNVSYMLQKDLLLPFKTVLDNIAMPLIIKGKTKKEARELAKNSLAEFGLEGYEKKYPSSLSGGMKQRAALLRSYLFSKDVIMLDEPFSSLDYITKLKMYAWFTDMVSRLGISAIFITHDIQEALTLSDKIYLLYGKPAHIKFAMDMSDKSIKDPLNPKFAKNKKILLDMIEES